MWKQISPEELDQNSVGTLTLVPGKSHGKGWKDHGNGDDHGNQDTLYWVLGRRTAAPPAASRAWA